MPTYKTLKCTNCNKEFKRELRSYKSCWKNIFCSVQCNASWKSVHGSKKLKCKNCNKEFFKFNNQIKKTKNHFCSRSCNAIYQNSHKKIGSRRSKLEKWLEKKLPELYPNLEFHFNRKDTINSELDIYIPSLKLAFELNGIFHYEPIYGEDKLASIQNNDNLKFAACQEKNISLCSIDVSSQKYFKEKSSQKFLDIIINIIDMNIKKLAPLTGFEPAKSSHRQ